MSDTTSTPTSRGPTRQRHCPTDELRAHQVLVTSHALDAQDARCAERWTVSQIQQAVTDALIEGRHSASKPEWLEGPSRRPLPWPPDRARAFVVHAQADGAARRNGSRPQSVVPVPRPGRTDRRVTR